MLNLGIGDKLLVKQTSSVLVSPWGYRIYCPQTNTVIVSVSGLTADYVEVSLSSETYDAYEDYELLLEILNGSGTVIESDFFLISDTMVDLDKVELLTGLLGENQKQTADQGTDYENGYEKARVVNLYSDVALTTEIAEYNWAQTFVTDFRPDYRYQTSKVTQKEST